MNGVIDVKKKKGKVNTKAIPILFYLLSKNKFFIVWGINKA